MLAGALCVSNENFLWQPGGRLTQSILQGRIAAFVPLARSATVMKLTRKQIREGLETVPVEAILGKDVARELTPKQKRFALEIAKGATKADAYRKAYKQDASKHTLVSKPYHLAADDRIKAEIEAYERAIEAAKYRTPAALRELVIQSLVSVVINPETKDSVKVAAAKVLGTVTEVAAFTERKEIKTISSSVDAKTRIMGELKRIIADNVEDATIIESQAESLLSELMPSNDAANPETSNAAPGEPHPGGTPRVAADEAHASVHTIPLKQSFSSADHPTPSSGEHPPVNES